MRAITKINEHLKKNDFRVFDTLGKASQEDHINRSSGWHKKMSLH